MGCRERNMVFLNLMPLGVLTDQIFLAAEIIGS